MRNLSALALVFAAGLAVSGCDIQAENGNFDIDFAAGKATDTWSRTYTIQPGGRFELINVNGRITAESTDGKDVVVEGRRTAKARSDEAALQNVKDNQLRAAEAWDALAARSRKSDRLRVAEAERKSQPVED